VGNAPFVSQELVDVLAVSLKQIIAFSYSNHHCIEFIRVEWKKETGKANEIEHITGKQNDELREYKTEQNASHVTHEDSCPGHVEWEKT